MKMRGFLSIMIIILLLTGCTVNGNQAGKTAEEPTQTVPVAASETTLPQLDNGFIVDGTLDQEAVMDSYRENQLETAQKMAELYIDALKSGLDLAKDEDAIEIIDLLFDRQTLIATDLQLAENMADGYQCNLSGSGPNGDRIVPLFILFQEDTPRFYSPLSHYGKQSRRSVEIYLDLLLKGDATKLSEWLSIDGGSDYFLAEANRLTAYYKLYALNNAEIVNFDYDYETNRFVYRIQDGNGKPFNIFMLYGDGFSMPDIYAVDNS